MKLKSWIAIAGIAASSVIASGSGERVGAVTTTLYDGSSGTTPNAGSSPYFNFANFLGGVQTAGSGVTNLDTSANEVSYAGYSNYNSALTTFVNPLFPVLDNNAGYTLSFTVQIKSQTNGGTNGANRAGFSAIVLGSDKKGIEIGFRNSDIFSQDNANFNAIGEQKIGISISELLAARTTYDLTVLGNNYTLSSGGNTLIGGVLRDYTPAAAAGGLANVYNTANFLFFGDDTTSAGANVDIQNITLNTNTAAVPEPSSLLGTGVAIGFGAILKRRLRKLKIKN